MANLVLATTLVVAFAVRLCSRGDKTQPSVAGALAINEESNQTLANASR
jgi:hypothetical protein